MRKWVFLAAMAACAASADPRRVDLMEELVKVGAMERRTLLVFPLQQQGAQLEVKFTSKSGGEGVRMAVYSGHTGVPLADTPYEVVDSFRVPLASGQDYRIEIENLRQRLGHAVVDVQVSLLFGVKAAARPESAARVLESERRRWTIAASLGLFFTILGYSAIQLGPALLARWRGER